MATNHRRQQSGFACQECRRRKVRCDRRLPCCGLCVETGTVCVTIDRQAQKGLRKGQISAMRSQIASLQSQLNKQLGCDADGSQSPILQQTTPCWDKDLLQGVADLVDMNDSAVDSFTLSHSLSTTSMLGQGLVMPAAPPTSNLHGSPWMVDSRRFDESMMDMDLPKGLPQLLSPADTTIMKMPSLDTLTCQPNLALFEHDEQQVASSTGTMSPFMTEHERADLDQVFFDRVHPILPLFYRRRCHGWINQPHPGTAQACLRSAMRTIAAAMSAPGARFCDQLYAETRRLLDEYTATSKETHELDYIQAWLLLGYYELLRVGESQAMLTAARCSRHVLMARLFEIDAAGSETNIPQVSPTTPQQDSYDDDSFCVVEEKRRTFWLAYCLDCFLYSRNEYPPMMQKEMICTRLPAPEANFQNNQPVYSPFLADVLAAKATEKPSTSLSSFAECVVLATLYVHCSSHRSSRMTEQPGSSKGDFWPRLKHLAATAKTRMQVLAADPPQVDSDPMLLFAHMVARAAVIKLGQAASSAQAWGAAEQQQQQHKRRASAAAAEMVWLTKQIPYFGYFTAHPFLPDLLACAIGFFNAERGASTPTLPDAADNVGHLIRVLKDLQGMNSLARADSYNALRLFRA